MADRGTYSRVMSIASNYTEGSVLADQTTAPPPPPLTRRQWLIFADLAVLAVCVYIVQAVISPFFPRIATEKGASLTEIGIIFGIYALGQFVGSFIFGNCLGIMGVKFMFLAGIFIRGGSDIIFSFLHLSPPGAAFVNLCVVVRIVESLGAAAFSTAMHAIVAKEYQGRMSQVFGFLNIFLGVGVMLGPPIGGVLYDIGDQFSFGFSFPFIVLGSLMMVMMLISIAVLPKNMDEGDEGDKTSTNTDKPLNKKKPWFLPVLLVPYISLNMLSTFFVFSPIVFVEISLEQHLRRFSLTPGQLGLMFTCQTGAFSIASAVWGRVGKYYTIPRAQCVISLVLYSFGCLLLGPSPYLGLSDSDLSIGLVIGSLIINGIGASGLNNVCFTDSIEVAKKAGFPDNMQTNGVVSGLYLSFRTLGNFVGPTLGNYLVEQYDFATTISLFGLCLAAVCLITVLAKIIELLSVASRRRKRLKRREESVGLLDSRNKQNNGSVY